MAGLDIYRQKRNFDRTGEPEGGTAVLDKLSFAIQHHLASRDHYDLRLEHNGVLLSWALPKGPSFDTRDKRLAVKVEDHPLDYKNFEGTIPKGEYGGGTVLLWDEGIWEPRGDVGEGLEKGSLKFNLKGRRLKGGWALVRLKGKEDEDGENWLLIKEKDEYTQEGDGISEFVTSVRTGRTVQEIETGQDEKNDKNPFDKTEVQLAKLTDKIPSGKNWLFELKYDGYRIVSFIEGNTVRLMTRNGKDYSNKFKGVVPSLADLAAGRAMVLDGEMAVLDASGKTDFQALQNYIRSPSGKALTYIVFDLLALDGVDLRNRPLFERKEKLEALMKDAPNNLHYSRHVQDGGEAGFEAACKAGMEGIVGKKAESVYSGSRSGDWVKIKCERRQEFVIGGYIRTDKRTNGISSLLLGVYEGGKLIYCGRAGTGLSEADSRRFEDQFKTLVRDDPMFVNAPKIKADELVYWLEPDLAAEIKFAEWTSDNLLRQASFKGLRTDKNPKEIHRETEDLDCEEALPEETEENMDTDLLNKGEIMIAGVKVTHPDKIIFDDPITSKEDVIRYYERVSERMLPYVSNRILSIVRCPKGIRQTCFYKKHPGADSKGIVPVQVSTSDGGEEEYFYIADKAGLLYEAQMGTLEFHTWGSRAGTMEKPDMMVFDLDPDEGMDLKTVRQGVRDVRELLSQLELNTYLKTSGGKGYHVVVPLTPSVSWDGFYDFARRVVEVMEQKWPDRYTGNVRKNRRTGKIFVDWMRNGRGATSVAPYSLRARKGAKISMPIGWDELDTVAPDGIGMAEAVARLERPDPWAGFLKERQQLRQTANV